MASRRSREVARAAARDRDELCAIRRPAIERVEREIDSCRDELAQIRVSLSTPGTRRLSDVMRSQEPEIFLPVRAKRWSDADQQAMHVDIYLDNLGG